MMTNERLAEIEARNAARTQGTWISNDNCRGLYVTTEDDRHIVCDLDRVDDGDPLDRGDLAFIANASTDIPDLIAEVRELRSIRASLRDVLASIADEAESAEDARVLLDIAATANEAIRG